MNQQAQSGALGPRRDGSSRIQKTESAADRMAALKAHLSSWKPPSKTKDVQDQSRSTKGTSRPHISLQHGPSKGLGNESNPYYDEKLASQETGGGKQRESRRLIFNQKGKYIQQGNAIRRQAALEAMKKRIAEQTRRVGIDEDLDVEKNFVVEAPPAIEWWDEGLVDGTSYSDIDDLTKLKINIEDSIVTEYIQHPVALEPPQDRNIPAPKAMYLTAKEQAKIRRQRRMAELKEMQAKIRLGLVPAPPPKVKKGNLMRVLGDAAVKDPTAVEARVNREIAERHDQHLETNETRKLTKEQKQEKLATNQDKDAERGIYVLVFKINSLANGQHRYKIWRNADQLALTGTCIMHPKFSLIIVEGGQWSINKYKKLMLNRINWTENSPSRDRDGNNGTSRDWLSAEDSNGDLKDMSLNECKLIFEGEQKARGFKKWSSKVCETDAEARDILARAKMDSFWSLAKGMS
ncbi:U4/U5/U6 small nuclear ribonucleoprotein prp3 [Cladobotryum mycophilum]|uniref:U4/U5/U6 small nuclear ribonucleoprotein prp3 n=1 Tax=Cladobotryum mycophilum TaxID=491253 RepID=A0ABR0SAC1_9HYPO